MCDKAASFKAVLRALSSKCPRRPITAAPPAAVYACCGAAGQKGGNGRALVTVAD